MELITVTCAVPPSLRACPTRWQDGIMTWIPCSLLTCICQLPSRVLSRQTLGHPLRHQGVQRAAVRGLGHRQGGGRGRRAAAGQLQPRKRWLDVRTCPCLLVFFLVSLWTSLLMRPCHLSILSREPHAWRPLLSVCCYGRFSYAAPELLLGHSCTSKVLLLSGSPSSRRCTPANSLLTVLLRSVGTTLLCVVSDSSSRE